MEFAGIAPQTDSFSQSWTISFCTWGAFIAQALDIKLVDYYNYVNDTFIGLGWAIEKIRLHLDIL